MRRIPTVIVTVLGLPFLSGSLRSEPVEGLYNTGVDDEGVVQSAGAEEIHYRPGGLAEQALVVEPAVWPAPPVGSAYIGPSPFEVSDPDGEYIYTLSFDLTGYRSETAVITGSWNADDSIRLLLNGEEKALSTRGWSEIESFSVIDGFVPGVNTLEFIVTNQPNGGGHNPTSFLLAGLAGEAERGNPDDFYERVPLEGPSGRVNADSSAAGSQPGEPPHGDRGPGATLWWSWLPPEEDAGKLAVFDTEGSDFDTILAVYTGATLDELVEVTANDDRGLESRTSLAVFPIEAGTEYRVVVDGFDGAHGDVFLRWTTQSPEGNDAFEDRAALSGLSGQQDFDNVATTSQAGEPAHATAAATGATLWWSWTAPGGSAGKVLILDTQGSSFDTALAVYGGSALGDLRLLAESDDRGNADRSSLITVAVEEGGEYQIAVDGVGGARGRGRLNWRTVPTVTNDDFRNRIRLEGTSGQIEAYNFGMTVEPKEPAHGSTETGASIWWGWEPPESQGMLGILTVEDADFDVIVAVYTGVSFDKLEPVESMSSGEFGLSLRQIFTIEAGVEYKIVVAGHLGAQGNLRLRWDVQAPPSNDDFSRRAGMFGAAGQAVADNIGATLEDGETGDAAGFGGSSVWWTWSPPALEGDVAIIDTIGSDFDTILAVYRGSTLAELRVVEVDDDGGELGTSAVVFSLQENTVYQIAVSGFSGAQGNIVLNWQILARPENDAFARRETLEGDEGSVQTTNFAASMERGEPLDSLGLEASLWWSWTAPGPGVVTFDTTGSTFDSFLGVYTGESLLDLVTIQEDDDGGEGLASRAFLPISGAQSYQVAVASFSGERGIVKLSWDYRPACGTLPSSLPSPPDGAVAVAADVELGWSRTPRRRRKTIYGEDDRQDRYEVDDPEILRLWDSTVALVPIWSAEEREDGSLRLPADTFGEIPLELSLAE